MRSVLVLCLAACSGSPAVPDAAPGVDGGPPDAVPAPTHAFGADELALRHKLGIPDDAERVILFGQNAHLDIDWQHTFADYYSLFVGQIFTEARQLLDDQPRAYYAICEMAFLEEHLSEHPEERAALAANAARGALRVVGGGMTSPDTLLPEPELLFHDYLYGLGFAEDNLGVRPTAAWLPDSFGHSATAPDVLAAAGYTSVAFSRIDGASTLFYEVLKPQPVPPGSTLATLTAAGSDDFIWEGAGGSQILAHFMSGFGFYCQGDNIDYDETIQTPGAHTGAYHGDDPTFTDGKIDGYAAELVPLARTPYLFVPIGCDFQHPNAALISYLDGYNQRRYPTTHVWAAVAPFDDFATLVSAWRDGLPTVGGELSPYFMGFYGSRADLKRGARDAAAPFLTAEVFASALGDAGATIVAAATPALRKLTRADHHDFVTGTSSNDVVANEQTPLLAEAQAAGAAELAQVAAALAGRIPVAAGATGRVLVLNAAGAQADAVVDIPAAAGLAPTVGDLPVPAEAIDGGLRVQLNALPTFGWTALDLTPGALQPPDAQVTLQFLDGNGQPATGSAVTRVVLSNAHVSARMDAMDGVFALTALTVDGETLVVGPSFLLQDYDDSGGLWRLGNEMPGCALTERAADAEVETVEVLAASPLLARVAFHGVSATREVSLTAGSDALDMAVTTGADMLTTRTVTWSFAVPSGGLLTTSSPAGSVERQEERIYEPTFWPAVAWASVGDTALLLRQSTGVRMRANGEMEVMAARWTPMEQCDVEGGMGDDAGMHRIEWRVTAAHSALDAEAQSFNRPPIALAVGLDQAATPDLAVAASVIGVSGEGIVSTVKLADRGSGTIVRVIMPHGSVTLALPAWLAGKHATLVDVAERDLRDLGVVGTTLALDAASDGPIVSVRFQ